MPNKECSHSKLFREKFLSREKSHSRKLVSATKKPHHAMRGAVWGGL